MNPVYGKEKPSPTWLDQLDHKIESALLSSPSLLNEYDLTKQLIAQNVIPKNCFSSPERMFKTHFLIKGALLRIQRYWWKESIALLDINLTQIQVLPLPTQTYHNQSSQALPAMPSELIASDSLWDYYHDWSIFSQTSAEDVVAMINDFWASYGSQSWKKPSSGQIDKACNVLSLDWPAELNLIKRQYRLLASQTHPDKGGDSDGFKKVQEAYQTLKNALATG